MCVPASGDRSEPDHDLVEERLKSKPSFASLMTAVRDTCGKNEEDKVEEEEEVEETVMASETSCVEVLKAAAGVEAEAEAEAEVELGKETGITATMNELCVKENGERRGKETVAYLFDTVTSLSEEGLAAILSRSTVCSDLNATSNSENGNNATSNSDNGNRLVSEAAMSVGRRLMSFDRLDFNLEHEEAIGPSSCWWWDQLIVSKSNSLKSKHNELN